MANKTKAREARARGGPSYFVAIVIALAIAFVIVFGVAANDSRVKTINALNDRLKETIAQRDEAVSELIVLRVKVENLETSLGNLGVKYAEAQEDLAVTRDALRETRTPGAIRLVLVGLVGMVAGVVGTIVVPKIRRRGKNKKRRNHKRR